MSNALMEAMASGLSVITTDIAENRELVKHEKNGILIPPKNTDALARAIERLFFDPVFHDHLGDVARASVKNRFDFPIIIEKMREFLERI